ncbi:hypothetical protein P7K49_011031, partial [Saguinus oedipus]
MAHPSLSSQQLPSLACPGFMFAFPQHFPLPKEPYREPPAGADGLMASLSLDWKLRSSTGHSLQQTQYLVSAQHAE